MALSALELFQPMTIRQQGRHHFYLQLRNLIVKQLHFRLLQLQLQVSLLSLLRIPSQHLNPLLPNLHSTIIFQSAMEDLDPSAPVPGVDAPLPEDTQNDGDPLSPSVEEENNPDPPAGEPYQDVEATGENEVDKDALDEDDDSDSDNESLLSEVDEDQFQDFDPAAISLDRREEEIAIDDDNVKLLGVHKRKRAEGEGVDGEARKKKKERRRDRAAKKERRRRNREGSEPFSGGEEIDGKRRRKGGRGDGEGGEARRRRVENDVDESLLAPEERKRRELDRKMDEALRSGKTRISKKDGIVRAHYALLPPSLPPVSHGMQANMRRDVGSRTSRRRRSGPDGAPHGRSRPPRLRRPPTQPTRPAQTGPPPLRNRPPQPWRCHPRIHRGPRKRPPPQHNVLPRAIQHGRVAASVRDSEGAVRCAA